MSGQLETNAVYFTCTCFTITVRQTICVKKLERATYTFSCHSVVSCGTKIEGLQKNFAYTLLD